MKKEYKKLLTFLAKTKVGNGTATTDKQKK
jgi:hypothetical protein